MYFQTQMSLLSSLKSTFRSTVKRSFSYYGGSDESFKSKRLVLKAIGFRIMDNGQMGVFEKGQVVFDRKQGHTMVILMHVFSPKANALDSLSISSNIHYITMVHQEDQQREDFYGQISHDDCILIKAIEPINVS